MQHTIRAKTPGDCLTQAKKICLWLGDRVTLWVNREYAVFSAYNGGADLIESSPYWTRYLNQTNQTQFQAVAP